MGDRTNRLNHNESRDIDSKHRQQVSLGPADEATPKVAPNAYVAPCATLAGNVEVWDQSSIWYGCVIRADVRLIRIGARTNIQDRTVITEAHHPLHADHDGSTIVGHNVTVGTVHLHRASHRIASHRIASHRIASHRIAYIRHLHENDC